MAGKKKVITSCDCCGNLVYDDEYGDYVCEANMDEDEYARFISQADYVCPYYHPDNEYLVVRHQM